MVQLKTAEWNNFQSIPVPYDTMRPVTIRCIPSPHTHKSRKRDDHPLERPHGRRNLNCCRSRHPPSRCVATSPQANAKTRSWWTHKNRQLRSWTKASTHTHTQYIRTHSSSSSRVVPLLVPRRIPSQPRQVDSSVQTITNGPRSGTRRSRTSYLFFLCRSFFPN